MLQGFHQITSYPSAVYAIGNGMPGMQRFITLPKNRLGSNEHREDVKEQDQHKRPWYNLTLHC